MKFVDPRRSDAGRKNAPRKGEVWLAETKAAAGPKARPVIILKRDGDTLTAVEISTRPAGTGDVTLSDPGYAGVRYGSTVLMRNRLTLRASDLQSRLGVLADTDMHKVFRRAERFLSTAFAPSSN